MACALYAINGFFIIMLSYSNAKIVDYAQKKEINSMIHTAFTSLGLILGAYIFIVGATIARLCYVSNAILTLKSDIIKCIFRRPIHSFLGKEDAYYLNLLSTDIELYRSDVLNIYPFMFSSIASVLFASVMIWKLHFLLFISAIIMALLPILTGKPFTLVEQRYKSQYSNESEKYTNLLRENIEGYETIRFGTAENGAYNRFMNSSINQQATYSRYAFVNTISFETLLCLAGFSNIICLGLGGWFVTKGVMSAAMLFAASNYFVAISNGINNITNYCITIKSSKQVKDKLFEESTNMIEEKNSFEFERCPEIIYKNVSLRFGDRILYDKMSFRFMPGGCYAIVGESGSGKSTITRLLLKYYTDYQGEILVDKQDIRSIPDSILYRLIGVVNQTPYLFNASLYENITMFSDAPSKNNSDYEELLRLVHLEELSKRIGDKPLGDFGELISGGERQRINIARSLWKKNKVLILDEPTTGLDPENVKLIHEFIFSCKNITRIVITHNWDKEYLLQFDGIVTINNR